MILRLPGNASLLRGARIERHDLQMSPDKTRCTLQMILTNTFSLPADGNLSKKAQFEEAWVHPELRQMERKKDRTLGGAACVQMLAGRN